MTKELIAKLEALEGPDEAVFREVFFHISPPPHGMVRDDGWANLRASFFTMITASAWESAAIMLVPEGYEHTLSSQPVCPEYNDPLKPGAMLLNEDGGIVKHANHPAIALLICILKAKEPVE